MFAPMLGTFVLGCLSSEDPQENPAISIHLDVGDSVEFRANDGLVSEMPLDVGELRVQWHGFENGVATLLFAIETEYGRILEGAESTGWAGTDEYRRSFSSVSLFDRTSAEPIDFHVEEDGHTETFSLDVRVIVQLLDQNGESLVSGSRQETTRIRIANVEGDTDEDAANGENGDVSAEEDETHTLWVTVTNLVGTALEGATVRVFEDEDGFGDVFADEIAEMETDEDGRASLTVESGSYWLEADHEEYGPEEMDVEIEDDESVVLMLAPSSVAADDADDVEDDDTDDDDDDSVADDPGPDDTDDDDDDDDAVADDPGPDDVDDDDDDDDDGFIFFRYETW